jgi:hypothetical protein
MGALPKNKITSVERGKRRKGNTPKIKVQHPTHVLMPLSKKTLFGRFLQLVNITGPATQAKTGSKADAVTTENTTPVTKKSKTTKKTVNRRAAAGTVPQQQSRATANRAMSSARMTPQSSTKTSTGTKGK